MSALRFVSYGLTHVGLVRRRNEDAFLDRPEVGTGCGLWAVADGMGGHDQGDYASARIVAALGAIRRQADMEDFEDEVKRQVARIDIELRERAAAIGPQVAIASTVVTFMVYDDAFSCVWAGDSRLYHLRDGEFRQVTTDHSRVRELIDAGQLPADAAAFHPEAHVVTQAIGGARFGFETRVGVVRPGDRFLLCSDGLSNTLSDAEIAGEIAASEPRPAAERLIDLVLERGAVDNVTVVIVAVEAAGQS